MIKSWLLIPQLAAAKPTEFALFYNGYPYAASSKYVYATNLSVFGAFFSAFRSYVGGAGNEDVGVFVAGRGYGFVDQDSMEKYTYSSDAVSALISVLGLARFSVSGVGNSTVALFAGGRSGSPDTGSTYVDKFTYSDESIAVGTILSLQARGYMSAVGNSTLGIFSGGFSTVCSQRTDIYTYATDARTAGSVLSVPKSAPAAAGVSTYGIISGGDIADGSAVTSTEKYTYATNGVTTAGSLSTAKSAHGAAGNTTHGIFAGGLISEAATATSEKYTYASDTFSPGGNLKYAQSYMVGVSTVPGGF